ncbi:MAG: cadherin-like beta sandwich domain-containing protein [Desulfitobacteriaceae bacterium]|nr:cadherin-like beta sandwich domain-containing protein [Desulfitobacteriaceae bacterium]
MRWQTKVYIYFAVRVEIIFSRALRLDFVSILGGRKMQKKITSLLLTVAMLLSLFTLLPVRAFAADGTTWDGNAYPITQGEGTKDDPYIIDTAGKLAYLAQNPGLGFLKEYYYRLEADLGLNGSEHDWVPIGNMSSIATNFQGHFDGNGHIISNMSTPDEQNAGLFGVISGATIKNLSVSGDAKAVNTWSGRVCSGGIVGIAVNSKIINCYHSGNVESDTNRQSNDASRSGGIVGSISESEIINCYHSGNVTANNTNGPPYNYYPNAGGVAGYQENDWKVKYCYWDNGSAITPLNAHGIGNATETVANVVYFSGTTPTLATEITVGSIATNNLLAALNANLDVLQDDTLFKWTGSDGYPTFASEKWAAAASNDATLSALTISSGTLSPLFASGTSNYTASVAHSVSSINITPKVNQPDAAVTINGSATASGSASPVALNVGDNNITIQVIAEDNTTSNTYTITITRVAATDASINSSTASFDKYASAAGCADVTITKSDGDHTLSDIKNGATVLRKNIDYIIDGNTVTIKKQYLASLPTESAVLTFDYNGGSDPVLTITITDSTPAVSSDATLSDLTISAGTLSPAFFSDITSYTANVAHSIASVNITPTVNQADASVTIKGSAAASGTPSAVGLDVGDNTITIVVTAQDDSTTQTYTITITRAAASSSKGGGGGGSSPTYYSASVDTKSNNGEINFDKTRSTPGSKVTITVTPDEGYEIDRLIILDKDGHEVSYTKNVDGTYSFTMPSGDITVNALFTEIATVIPTVLPEKPPALPFVDVEKSDWYYHSVDYVYRNQWFAGATEEHFEPNTPMSRAMLVTVLWRLEGQADINVNQVFLDVPPGEYYAKGVDWANSQEIVQGYGNGTFGPLDNITREQMALILYKFAQFKGYDTSATTNLDSFHDASQVSPWAVDAVKWAVASQILSGKGSGTLDPSGPATRAEVASILTRFVTNLEG